MEGNFYEKKSNVDHYINFTPSHDGTLLVDLLVKNLAEGDSVIELGMGPGKDFSLLSNYFQVTGSDYSKLFLEIYREKHENADLMHLDARTLETERKFDAIFSNKALIHFSSEELQLSFNRQHQLLNDNGLILHSFWYGERTSVFNDLTLVEHNEKDLSDMLENLFDILDIKQHAKMSENDSIYVLARKK